ncbi:hypothetical protein AcW1_008681 [Taiwanofungus camphoratus]|nr:hypothetical protein AcW1_008681 [Antrodia cinnamomea]
MEERSQTEQERDIRELLRRAERSPVKTSTLRRDALKRLIDLAHSPYPNLKLIAATNLKHFIKDFPDFEDDAINAVYDLCEDQVSKVRISGYAAIVDVSREQHKWVKRNADVLVQLLQSDEPEEVMFVKRALAQHLDMDPTVTLGVLCDQVVPSDEPLDDEEQSIRDRLRSLVLAFVTGEAKRAIVERHTSTPGGPADEALVSGLLKAVSKLAPADTDIIVKEILLSLPSFKPFSDRGKQLLGVVIDRAKSTIKTDLPPGSERSSLENTRYYLDLASFIVVDKCLTQPSQLLRFYFTSLMPKMIFLRLNEDAQTLVMSNTAALLSASEQNGPEGRRENSGSPEDMLLRKQVPAALLQLFSEVNIGDRRPWAACQTLLRACLRLKDESEWTVPSYLMASLRSIQTLVETQGQQLKVDDMQDIQSLIRSLLQPAVKPAPPGPSTSSAANTDISKGMSSSKSNFRNDRRIMNVKRKYGDLVVSLPPRPPTAIETTPGGGQSLPSGHHTERQRQHTPQARQRSSTVTTHGYTQNGHQSFADDQPRAAKRAKKGGGSEESRDIPSLLSRMTSSTPPNASPAPEHTQKPLAAKRRPTYARSDQDFHDPDKDPVGGYSIKGAAKATNRSSPPGDSLPLRSSLLDRMQDDDAAWEAGGPKRKRWIKTFSD